MFPGSMEQMFQWKGKTFDGLHNYVITAVKIALKEKYGVP